MKGLTTTGARVIFGIPFLVFGFFHFTGASSMAGMVPLPAPQFWVYLTGAAHILAAVAFFTRIKVKLAAILLAIMLLVFILAVHLPNAMNPDKMQMEMMNILKNIGLIGGALAVAGIEVLQEENSPQHYNEE